MAVITSPMQTKISNSIGSPLFLEVSLSIADLKGKHKIHLWEVGIVF